MVKMNIMLALSAVMIIGVVFTSGCVGSTEQTDTGAPTEINTETKVEAKAETKAETDDGAIAVYPSSGMGLYSGKSGNGGPQETWVGPVVDGGGSLFVTRGLYRFDISEWTEGAITFHLHCLGKEGSPSALEIYVVDDFGSLPAISVGPKDVSEIWNLPETGESIAETTPSIGGWLKAPIPASVVQEKKTSEGYLAFMLKVSNEDVGETGFYQMSNHESAVARNEDKPCLKWSK